MSLKKRLKRRVVVKLHVLIGHKPSHTIFAYNLLGVSSLWQMNFCALKNLGQMYQLKMPEHELSQEACRNSRKAIQSKRIRNGINCCMSPRTPLVIEV